uniref:Uncharacterized protein n=1 Tax=Streptomyces avermitilis TaxID=33903 RepID=A0A499VP05_STRAX|nr:hypothetical protein SAVMC3_80910 [Streptomyces avermitilis]
MQEADPHPRIGEIDAQEMGVRHSSVRRDVELRVLDARRERDAPRRAAGRRRSRQGRTGQRAPGREYRQYRSEPSAATRHSPPDVSSTVPGIRGSAPDVGGRRGT